MNQGGLCLLVFLTSNKPGAKTNVFRGIRWCFSCASQIDSCLNIDRERETPPRFAQHGTFEYEYSQRWKSLDEMEKQQREQVEKNMKDAKDKLESEMEDAYHEHQANLLRQDLMRRQEELRRMEELHNQEMQKRKEMQLRQEEERRRREEEMMIRQREMEEQMRRQREESYSRMGYMDPRERDMRMGGGGAMNMGGKHEN